MTKNRLIEIVETANSEEECVRAAAALIEFGLVSDDGESFDVDLIELAEWPDSVKKFVGGMLAVNFLFSTKSEN